MALIIQENKGGPKDLVKANRRLYLNADGKAVEDGDPEARTLFCSKGKMISRAKAEAAGVTFGVEKKAPAAKKSPATKKKGK